MGLKKSPLTGVEDMGFDPDEEMGEDAQESLARPVKYVSAVFVGLGLVKTPIIRTQTLMLPVRLQNVPSHYPAPRVCNLKARRGVSCRWQLD